MIIEWKTWTSVPDEWTLGNGVHFNDNLKPRETSLVAWIEGFEWHKGNPETVEIWCIAPDEVTTSRTITAMKKAIEAYVKEKKPLCSKITSRISACPNA